MNNTAELEVKEVAITERVKSLVIVTAEDYTTGAGYLREINGLRKEIGATFDPIIEQAHRAHKEAINQKKRHEEPLAQAERVIRGALAAYDAEQDRKKREEERRLQAEARKLEEERRLAEAVEAEQSGDQEQAEQIIAAPVYVAPVVLAKETPKVDGVSFRDVWKFDIIDPDAVPREYLTPDEKKIGGVVRALKGAAKIPGVRVYSEKTTAFRGAA